MWILPVLLCVTTSDLPTELLQVADLPYPVFPEREYWFPRQLTEGGWVLMVKTSDPILTRRVELWHPELGVLPVASVTSGFELAIADSAVDDPGCRPGTVYVSGMLHADDDPDDLLGFVYEVDTLSGTVTSVVEEGLRVFSYVPFDGSYFVQWSYDGGAVPNSEYAVVGVPAPPLADSWYLLQGIGSRHGWASQARNHATGERTVWTYARSTGSWEEAPVEGGDLVVDFTDSGLLLMRAQPEPGVHAYHSVASDGSIRAYPPGSYEAASSQGLVLERTQVHAHATGSATDFEGPLDMLDLNDSGVVIASDGCYQVAPVEPVPPATCILSVSPTSARDPGVVTIAGTGMDSVTAVTLAGDPANVVGESFLELQVQPVPSEPGFLDLVVENSLGTHAAVAELWPSLVSQASGIGGQLDIELQNGAEGLYLLVFGTSPASTLLVIESPPTWHGLSIDPAGVFAILDVNVFPSEDAVQLHWPVPADPGLSGLEVLFQAWCQQGVLGTNVGYSFTNTDSVSL